VCASIHQDSLIQPRKAKRIENGIGQLLLTQLAIVVLQSTDETGAQCQQKDEIVEVPGL
jgi:hypothetical protein